MHYLTKQFLLPLLVTLTALPASAATSTPAGCTGTDSIQDCATALVTAALPAQAAAVIPAAQDAASKGNAGATEGKPFSPSLTTFARALSGALDFLAVQTSDRAITVTTPTLGFGSAIRAKGQFQILQPTVWTSVTDAIQDPVKKAAATTNLKQALGDLDDREWGLYLGIAPDRNRLFSVLASGLRAKADPKSRQAQELLMSALKALPAAIPEFQADGKTPADGDTLLKDLADADRSTLLSALQTEATVIAEGFVAHNAMTKELRESFASHLQNDPQFVANVTYSERDPLVGRDTFSFKATYEYGVSSLSAFLRNPMNRSACGLASDAPNPDRCLAAFNAWNAANPDAQNHQYRVSGSIEYASARPYHLELPDYGAVLDLQNSHSILFSLKAGANISGGAKGPVRIDIGATYEDNNQDPTKHDRLVANLSFSVRVSDSLQIPVGIVYANHAQYLGEVDKHMGVHFGVTFRE